MINFIIGNVVSIEDEYVVIQNNGIGYKVFTSANSKMDLEIGKENQMLHTQMFVRDDGIYLYGFTSLEEMDMFNLLLRVSKVGPKIGIGVLSTLSPRQIQKAILTGDVPTLTKTPGIGKKTAERIIVELKDRIDIPLIETEEVEVKSLEYNQAIDGLLSLGYSRFEVEKAIKSLDYRKMTVEDIIREALKKLSSK